MPSYIERLLNSNVTNVSRPVSKVDKGTVGDKGIHGSQGMKQPPPKQSSPSSSESDQENDAAAALISLAGVCSSKKRSLQQQQQKDENETKHRRRVSSLSKTDDDKKPVPSFRRGATPRLLLERLRAHGKRDLSLLLLVHLEHDLTHRFHYRIMLATCEGYSGSSVNQCIRRRVSWRNHRESNL